MGHGASGSTPMTSAFQNTHCFCTRLPSRKMLADLRNPALEGCFGEKWSKIPLKVRGTRVPSWRGSTTMAAANQLFGQVQNQQQQSLTFPTWTESNVFYDIPTPEVNLNGVLKEHTPVQLQLQTNGSSNYSTLLYKHKLYWTQINEHILRWM